MRHILMCTRSSKGEQATVANCKQIKRSVCTAEQRIMYVIYNFSAMQFQQCALDVIARDITLTTMLLETLPSPPCH